ncbi:MAG: NAD(P)H-dependent oxidoreductase [Clostridiales bacterium]|jgi:flavodoxin|nr:NAD(P)H-dependent oxidoreductase [Clostridiales bacterium]
MSVNQIPAEFCDRGGIRRGDGRREMRGGLFLIAAFVMAISLSACNGVGADSEKAPIATPSAMPSGVPNNNASESPQSGEENDNTNAFKEEQTRVLVAYFSCTGNTRRLAEYAAEVLDAEIYEIKPKEPYTTADLNYSDAKSRTSVEQNDTAVRPKIAGSVTNMRDYDIIFIGYPIWWGEAPRIVSTFIESYDFAGKTIVPFCTSGSSEMGSSAENLQKICSDKAAWLNGRRWGSGASKEDIANWINGLSLETIVTAEAPKLKITVGGKTFTATMEDNFSAKALMELLSENPLTIQMEDYGGFEKTGPLGKSLPTNDEQISTTAGDLILYQGNQLVIFYGTNSWNYTRLGKIEGVTANELKEAFGIGNAAVTLSIN